MPTVIVDLRRDTVDGEGAGTRGAVHWKPTRRRDMGDHIVIPVGFGAELVGGVVVVEVDPTGPGWCWMVRESTAAGITRYVTVPDVPGPIHYADLVDVDPATLEPTAEPEAAWWAALDLSTVPTGGEVGQVLAKASSADRDTEWVDQSGGGGGAEQDTGWRDITAMVAPEDTGCILIRRTGPAIHLAMVAPLSNAPSSVDILLPMSYAAPHPNRGASHLVSDGAVVLPAYRYVEWPDVDPEEGYVNLPLPPGAVEGFDWEDRDTWGETPSPEGWALSQPRFPAYAKLELYPQQPEMVSGSWLSAYPFPAPEDWPGVPWEPA